VNLRLGLACFDGLEEQGVLFVDFNRFGYIEFIVLTGLVVLLVVTYALVETKVVALLTAKACFQVYHVALYQANFAQLSSA
jgi:hypothetical protein